MSRGYDYGPPVVADGGGGGAPATTTGELEDAGGGTSPHTPPANWGVVVVPGGSPSGEWLSLNDPSITTLAPTTGASGGPVAVQVNGTNFDADSVVEVDQAPVSTTYVSATRLNVSLNRATPGTVSLTVRNPTGEQESNAVTFTFT